MNPTTADEAMANARQMGLSPDSVNLVGRNFGRSLPVPASPRETGADDALPLAVRACDLGDHAFMSWLVEGRIPVAEVTLVVGDAGSGKTSYVLKITADQAARGCPVLFVSGEDPAEILSNRLLAIGVGQGWDPDEILRNVYFLALTGLQLIDSRWQSHLIAEVKRVGAILVVLDPLYELAGTQEDSNDAQRPVLRFLRMLISSTGTTVLICHHFGKAAEGRRKIDRVRGASAWYGAARAVYAIETRDEGLQVECLKMSRMAKPAPYFLARTIVSDSGNPGIWRSAIFCERRDATDAEKAGLWIVSQLSSGATFTTSALRRLVPGSGCSRQALTTALRQLEANGRITFTPGPRGAKQWRLTLPVELGNVDGSTLPTLPDLVPARSTAYVQPCPPPIGGRQGGRTSVRRLVRKRCLRRTPKRDE